MILKRTLITAALILSAQMAAALTAQELATQYQADGYGYISIRTGLNQIKVEAVKNGQKVEVIYDAATGSVLKTESRAIGTIANADAGPRLRDVPRDFVRDGSGDDSLDGGDDRGRGRGRDDDSSDDHGPDDHGSDDHGSDDHVHHAGSDDDSGSDDNSGRGRGRGRGGDDD
jgi:hypothetical protein